MSNVERVIQGEIKEWMLAKVFRLWQEEHGLKPDGICGPITSASLYETRESEMEGLQCSELAKNTLQIARDLIGEGEEGGNNSGPFVEMLLGKEYDGDTDDDGAWCAAFISHCIKEASDGEPPFELSFGAKLLFKRACEYGEKKSTPSVGDIVCWDRGRLNPDGSKSWMGHVGLVDRVEGDIFYAIEGNKGAYPSKVRRFKYELSEQTRLEGFASF